MRRAVLAVAVLDDVDLEPRDDGVLLPGARPLLVGWDELAWAAGPQPDQVDAARAGVARHLRLRGALDEVVAEPELARTRLRLLALPSARVPDGGWPLHRVAGGALAVGLGLALERSDALPVVAVPSVTLAAAGLVCAAGRVGVPGAEQELAVLEEHLEAMGTLAGARLARLPQQLAPVGDSDVPTLLASASFRRALAAEDPLGMRGAVVASRRRGWLDPRRLDPALASVAYELSDPDDRAFERPLLVTAEEVSEVRSGGRPAEIDLRDPVTHPGLPTQR
ncbi:hypothetical protein CLV35_1340 [Motilibacter peucedani]|uniref:Uncharacterized protein n=1 Tax=Motilibacter peucedani TaxID=598650 RepID=A0A420XRW9_9ACTN|nr:hypothetical protein CLV35_1340 [Motilibacter peucedani]